MARLRISHLAGDDLDTIRIFGEDRFGAAATLRHMELIADAFAIVRDQPLVGQSRPEYGDGIRSISRRPHPVFYRFVDGEVVIVRIVHAAQNPRPDLTDDE